MSEFQCWIACFWSGLFSIVALSAAGTDRGARVEIFGYGKCVELVGEVGDELADLVIDSVGTASVHFGVGYGTSAEIFSDVQRRYRKAVSGMYMLVSFAEPRIIEFWDSGELGIVEIVVGLSGDQYASGFFSIDDRGRVLGHGKVNGEHAVEILKRVEEIFNGKER